MAKRYIKYIIIFVILLSCISYINRPLSTIITSNWKIDIPSDYNELYSFSPHSFHGDGIRFHVLAYQKDISQSFEFRQVNTTDLDIIHKLLDDTEQITPKEFYPTSESNLIYIQKKNIDTLYIIYDSSDFKLYIIEDFI